MIEAFIDETGTYYRTVKKEMIKFICPKCNGNVVPMDEGSTLYACLERNCNFYIHSTEPYGV